ncbi:Stage II sporulation protein E (SpoIIE) [Streptomyces sp. TLI_053]|uniref:PP2C family protein-serine/threonine phosphatase n=1 Tax=Streptomyces sp. TLI_053 TaxID=1855352 RepID=UPI0008794151|nr:PP2C family protein-serine/threonine phosphatase [Streptomyces sp. TLI_053]SDT82845.1 Stage II sporulation protein E (SpoIIE) [Streptomyces sp. TLI_053]
MAEEEAALARFLERSHTASPRFLPRLVDETARRMGLASATVYLTDVQEEQLVPLPGPGEDEGETLAIEGTVAGRAYRTVSVQLSHHGPMALWLPLVDGIARIGVLHVAADRITPELLDGATQLAALTALTVVSKSGFSDLFSRVSRQRPMTTAAEMVWAFLPPRTLGTDRVTSAAALEPAYEIGGDAFDHGLDDGHLHLTVVDAMGHDLSSGLASAVALAGCRSTRRAGGTLSDIADRIDDDLHRWQPGGLLTGVFARLDLETGQLTWINAGHPPPLLIRAHHVVPGALEAPGELPLGLGPGYPRSRTVHRVQLEPGDRVLVHTDGVTEARSATGRQFGEDQLVDFVTRALAAGEPAPEALRRLVHAVLDRHDGRLQDDATIVLAEWHPPDPSGRHEEPGPEAARTDPLPSRTTAPGDRADHADHRTA